MLDNSRQANIVNSDLLSNCRVIIAGVGAGGSWMAYFLAKLGITDLTIYDFDKVEEANIRAQLFGLEDVNKLKVDVVKEKIKRDLGVDIIAHNQIIDANTNFDLNLNTIFLSLVDKIEVRKLIYEKLKGLPVRLIDARMGGEGWQIYSIKCDNPEECVYYEESLIGETREMPCGEKAVIYSTVSEVCEMINLIKKIINSENTYQMIRREMKSPLFLVKGVKE